MASIHPLFKDNQTNDMQAANKHPNNAGANPGMGLQPAVLTLTNNANLLEIVRRAAPSGSQVVDTQSIDAMMTKCSTLRPGVLLMDTACCKDISGTVVQLLQDQPNLVVVVAGKSEDSTALMKLTAAGHIYRFLLMPLAHSQTKLTLEAAMTQHFELGAANDRREANASDDDSEKRKSYLPAYIGFGAALIVVVGGVFFGLSRMGGDSQTASTSTATQNAAGAASKELALADAALAAGNLLEPPGESALDLYRSALTIAPKNPRAQAGIDAVANKLLEKAEAALTGERLEIAVTVLEQARDIAPDNARLKFLDSQVGRERERLKLTQAQDLGKKVRTLLATAQEAMDAGRLMSPAGNNARDSLLDARKLDPTDPNIAQAQRVLSNRLIEAARRAVEQNQIDQAQNLLASARQLGSAGAELSALERSMSETRTKNNSESQLAAAQKAAAAAAQAERAQAEREAAVAAQQKAAEPATPQSASTATSAPVQAPVVLKRTKTVAPVYPTSAKNRNVSGWVEVTFTVTQSGGVDNIRVTDADPKDVFDAAALQAVEQWRFEPITRDGKPTTQATKIRLRFDSPR